MMKRFLAIGLLLSLGACAWTSEYIDVPYQRSAEPTKVSGADTVSVSVTSTDAREAYRDRVSSKKNGFGTEAAPIYATNNVTDTIRAAVEQELAARGFRVAPGAIKVNIALHRFYSDFKTGFWSGDAVADFDAEVIVTNPSGSIVFARNYSAQGLEPQVQLASGENAQASLVKAMSAGVGRIVNDPDLIRALFQASAPTPAMPSASK